MNIDYKEKIKKLFALSKSRNEHEAKSALLKARELMAEYKLTEEDLEDGKEQRWGLIMAVPREVEDAAKNMNYTRFKASV